MSAVDNGQRVLTRVDVVDSVNWDARKELASLWQEHAPLPEGGLSEQFYDALIAVARWGADSAWDYAEPVGATPAPSVVRGEVVECVDTPNTM